MDFRTLARLSAAGLAALLLAAASSCGGGGGSSVTTGGGVIDTGNNQVPGNVIDGPTQYPGKQPVPLPQKPGPDGGATAPPFGNFQFGPNVFNVASDSNGVGRVVARSFSPGQKVAFVVVNMNPGYLDLPGDSGIPIGNLPQTSYSFTANLVNKTLSGATLDSDRPSMNLEQAALATQELLGNPEQYNGIDYNGGLRSVEAIYEREAEAWGKTPYEAEAVKSVSAISKGEERVFINVPATILPPPVEPGEENPNQDVSELEYPDILTSQHGRLVAIGSHCLVFLSTEINQGHPDNVTFTQSRLNRLAKEFDTVIYPRATAAFGPVYNNIDQTIFRDVNSAIVLTGDDFDQDGNVTVDLPGTIDTSLALEKRIAIFIFNGDAGGFFAFRPADEDNDVRGTTVGNCLYIGSDNFPANDSVWDSAFSVMAHEFQHKLYSDHGLKSRQTSYMWFNEGLSQLAIHLCGYTVNSGKIIPWAIADTSLGTGQVMTYLNHTNEAPFPMDALPEPDQRFSRNQAQYGSGFLFFLYMYEHYDPGVGKRIYEASEIRNVRSFPKLIEIGAQTTTPGKDGLLNTSDDVITNDTFEQVFAKFCIANFVDGIYADNAAGTFDSRFHYNTFDVRGTVNLATGTVVLPGVRTGVFPIAGAYPVIQNDRVCMPWCSDYLVFGAGDGRDFEIEFTSDPNFRLFMLPVQFNTATNAVDITQGVTINY